MAGTSSGFGPHFSDWMGTYDTTTNPPQALFANPAQLQQLLSNYTAPIDPNTPVQLTRSGRVSRPPPAAAPFALHNALQTAMRGNTAPAGVVSSGQRPYPSAQSQRMAKRVRTQSPISNSGGSETSTRPSSSNELGPPPAVKGPAGRPSIYPPEESIARRRARNKISAIESRKKKKEMMEDIFARYKAKEVECEEMQKRCSDLETQIHTLKSILHSHGIPALDVSRSGLDSQRHSAKAHLVSGAQQPIPEAAPIPQPPPSAPSVPHVGLNTPSTVGATAAAFNTPGYGTSPMINGGEWTHNVGGRGDGNEGSVESADWGFGTGEDYEIDYSLLLNEMFNIGAFGDENDANDADFIPPTSPTKVGDSSDDESDFEEEREEQEEPQDEDDEEEHEDEGEQEQDTPSKRRRNALPPVEEEDDEDLFQPIVDVPIPDQLYHDAMEACGVNSPEELAAMLKKLFETAGQGGVTGEQAEAIRWLIRIQEAKGMSHDHL